MRIPRTVLAAALAALAAPPLSAGLVTAEDGFAVETVMPGGPVVAQLDDGRILLSTGTFGADELSVFVPGGPPQLFADGFGSLAGLAQSPVTRQIVVGDSFGPTPLWILEDLDGDGDALDPGERVPHPATLPTLSNGETPLPFDLVFRPGTDELLVSGSTPFGVDPVLGVVVRVAGASASVFAEGLGLAGGMTFAGDELFVADLDETTFVGRVLTLVDVDGDGDALDPGESVEFATGLSGASDLVRAADGSFYLSGLTDPDDVSGAVGRLLPDDDGDGTTDGVDELVFDGFAFAGNLTLFENAGPFVPGVDGLGRLHVGDFTVPDGDRTIRGAPFCDLSIVGSVSTSAPFDVVVEAAVGAETLFVLSLDATPSTLTGIADVCFGFGAPFLVVGGGLVGGAGQTVTSVSLEGAGGAVGMPLAVQGFCVEDGRVGVGDGLVSTILP